VKTFEQAKPNWKAEYKRNEASADQTTRKISLPMRLQKPRISMWWRKGGM